MDHLLTVSLPTFVAERRRVVDILKRAGRRDDAAQIAKLVKPSLPVWVINQLARREGSLVKRLGALTGDLRRAPIDRQSLRGDPEQAGASDYARVMAAHRDTLKSLRAAAEKIMVAAGHGSHPHTLERVVHTLRAGVANDQTRAAIEAGRLLSEVGEQDFASLMGGLSSLRGGPTPRPSDPPAEHKPDREPHPASQPKGHPPARAADKDQARARAAEERAQARERAVAERERAKAQAAAARTVERLRAQVATAEKAASQENRALEAARREFSRSEERAGAARRALEAARRELETAQAAARALADR